jgi:hypothetical protein
MAHLEENGIGKAKKGNFRESLVPVSISKDKSIGERHHHKGKMLAKIIGHRYQTF